MKKALSLILVLVMVCGLVACGDSSSDANPAIVKYVEKNGSTLIKSMEDSFMGSSGMTCTSSIKAVGNGIVLEMNVNELVDLEPELKAQMRESSEEMSGAFDGMIGMMQIELPELEYLSININEKDGDNLFTITID